MDDQISRQAAIDEIKEIYEWHDNVTKERIIEHFVRLPSVQPYRPKGEWELAIGYDPKKRVLCTECHLMNYEPTPFCPNCGARMVRGEEHETN